MKRLYPEARLDAVEELVEEGRDTREYLEEVRREVLRKEELSWESERALEDAIERESERSKQLEEMAAELEKSGQKIDEKGLGNSELFEKLEEIRQLMAEVAAPELQEALRELQEAMEDPDPQALAESLKQFSEDQEAFQERLDRTIELLKQVRAAAVRSGGRSGERACGAPACYQQRRGEGRGGHEAANAAGRAATR